MTHARRPPEPQTPPRPRRRLVALLALVVLSFCAVSARLVHVQALSGDRYADFGASQRVRTVELDAERGSIFDRNGHDLAVSLLRPTVWADPAEVEDPAAVAAALAPVLGAEAGELEATLRTESRFAYLARRTTEAVGARVAELDLPGIHLMDEPVRVAPSGDLARAVLGQVGVDNVGLSGLELQYDDMLSGTPGQLVVEKDQSGRTIPVGEHELVPPERGDDLVLSIDRSLQHEAERLLADQISAKHGDGGSVIVSRPGTGEILAMANLVTDPDTGEVVATANNMAATAVYEPGSVNKVITVAAAIEEGLVSPSTVIEVPDRLQVADHLFTDHAPHPTEGWTVTRILTESSNVGTIKLAQMLGGDRLDAYLRRFGFGTTTALGLPHEESGILLDREDWSGTSIGSIPIGQGIAVTALQMLEAFNIVANDGVYVPPRLVLDRLDDEGERHPLPSPEPHRVISADTAVKMREMLARVVAEGTGQRGGIAGYTAAGKTGTARKPQPNGGYEDAQGRMHHIATFAGFVPAENPELSIIVVIDEPKGDIYASTVAAPVFRDLARYALRYLRVPPPAPGQGLLAGTADDVDAPGGPGDGERVRAAAATASTTPTSLAGGVGAQAGSGAAPPDDGPDDRPAGDAPSTTAAGG